MAAWYMTSTQRFLPGLFRFDHARKRFHLLKGCKFHLLVSHPPCGDACITDTAECGTGDSARGAVARGCSPPHPHPAPGTPAATAAHAVAAGTGAKRLKPAQGPQQITGAVRGLPTPSVQVPQQGDVEVGLQAKGVLRRKPGRGTATLSMSCSDKLAKWQLLGWQGALLSCFLAQPLRFHTVTCGCSSAAPPAQGTDACCAPHREPSAAAAAAQRKAVQRAVYRRCEGTWRDICCGGGQPAGARGGSMQQAASWLHTWRQAEPQVHLAPLGLGCRNCGVALDGRVRLTNTCIYWSSAALCCGGAARGVLRADGTPAGSSQVLLGKHGRPAGATTRQGHEVMLSRHSLLGQFTSLRAAVHAASDACGPHCRGSGPDSCAQQGQRCRGTSAEAVHDFNAYYRAVKWEFASVYMTAWACMIRTAAFSLWLCGNQPATAEQHAQGHMVEGQPAPLQ